MSFLNIQNKTFLILGVANKKSIAWHIANTLETEGAKVIYSVRSESRKKSLSKLLKNRQIVTCDVEDEQQINQLCNIYLFLPKKVPYSAKPLPIPTSGAAK